ncbi:acyl-CoA dehydrogenase family protein [Janthinobacterium tructae]|uniref:acyl-CoA dehydrogenase family protein n=1 Tax=Janthinobacterium tructae TaxID=2590869 RepID=UPI00249C2E8C|nr:acyl-CoA dehydrogenase family protein [Janthinobacterium tructae]MDI3292312.1 acyl-CoA dehydrogenase family protein [Janthinobacterium tructae]
MMDFRLTDEQQMLQDSLADWLSRHAGTQHGIAEGDHWREMAEMGWLGVALPAEYGGFGFSAMEQMLVAEAFGRHLVREPYAMFIVLSANLILTCGTEAQRQAWLPAIASGERKFAFAYAERHSRHRLDVVTTRARRESGGYVLDGEKILVLGAPQADRLIVSARLDGADDDAGGIGLFIVDPASSGVSARAYTTLDGGRAADIGFRGVRAEALLGAEGSAWPAIQLVADQAVAMLCAEGVGAMGALLEATLQYVKVRQQFGRFIGDFQVIQHRIVDMRIELDCARAATMLAASLIGADEITRGKAASAAKVQLDRAARFVGSNAIQLHGGIGMTDELSIGHYFKRLRMLQTLLGDADHHRVRFARLSDCRVDGLASTLAAKN